MHREVWNTLVARYAPQFGAFLQSWEWGAFQESLGREVRRIHIVRGAGVLVAQAVRMELPFGWKYWYVAKGPLGTLPPEAMAGELRESCARGAFLRVEPSAQQRGWHIREVNPATTSMIDLTQGWKHVLSGMKAKTRYNIRLAEKKGVTVAIAGVEAFDDFTRLLQQTAVRDGFSLHPLAYYRAMLERLQGGDAQAFLAIATYEGRPLAANLMIDFHGQRTYLHGASSNLHRNVMAPYALHKHLLVDAIEKGMMSYDFWGVAPVGARASHRWAGVTRFKLGFGGDIVGMPGTIDLPIHLPMYAIYRSARLLRRRPRARAVEME